MNLRPTEEVDAFVKASKLRYYNADLHKAAFALPNFVKEMIE